MVWYFGHHIQAVHCPDLEEKLEEAKEEIENGEYVTVDPNADDTESEAPEQRKTFKTVEEMIASLHANDTWWDKHVKYAIWYPICRFFTKWFSDKPREWKWNRQRSKRGYSDSDTWGFDHYLSRVISGGLKEMRSNLHGFPGGDVSFDKWKEILDDIIFAFDMAHGVCCDSVRMFDASEYDEQRKWFDDTALETDAFLYYIDDDGERKTSHVMSKEECERYDRGWKYFKEYFFQLWD